MRFVLLTVATGLALAGAAWADENVRAVQGKLRENGFYSGQIDGAYSTDLSAALTRYQIRHGLPITGQLDVDTSKALGAQPAVTNSAAGSRQTSDTWRRLRRGERQTSASARRSETAATEVPERSSLRGGEATGTSTEARSRPAPAPTAQTSAETTEPQSAPAARSSEVRELVSAPPAAARTSLETTQSASGPPAISSDVTRTASAPPAAGSESSFSMTDINRLRDYVAAFVLAGLDRNVGAEAEFFADRVEYYDAGLMDRESIRQDLKRYDDRWPERHFWIAGNIIVEPQTGSDVRVTFPLGFELRNHNRTVMGKVDKTLVLQPAGDDFQIVAVNERKAK